MSLSLCFSSVVAAPEGASASTGVISTISSMISLSTTATTAAASLLPPGAYVLTQLTGQTVLLTAEMLKLNNNAAAASTSGGSAVEVHAQLFIKDNKDCDITV